MVGGLMGEEIHKVIVNNGKQVKEAGSPDPTWIQKLPCPHRGGRGKQRGGEWINLEKDEWVFRRLCDHLRGHQLQSPILDPS